MKRLVFLATMLVCASVWNGCCGTASHTQVNENNKGNAQIKPLAPITNGMKLAFAHPVVMVNGIRADANNPQKNIEVVYPTDSTQNITLTIVDGSSVEHILQGQITTYKHTEFTKPDSVILVVPDDPETTYYDVIHNGYGEISICEYIQRGGADEEQGNVLLQMVLGCKRAISSTTIEFRFPEGEIDKNNPKIGNDNVLEYTLTENSQKEFTISLEQGDIIAKGILRAYKGNPYTSVAPIWISLSLECRNSLRQNGEVTLALYVPSSENQVNETRVVIVDPTENIEETAQTYGTLVGTLTLRRI